MATVVGTEGSDWFADYRNPPNQTTSGSDTLSGLGGDDYLLGGGGDDYADGGSGDDRIVGESGNDILLGGDGDDRLDADDTDNGGDDYLDGGNGDDYLFSGGGNDTIHGGEGNDYVYLGEHLQITGQVFAEAGSDTIIGSEMGSEFDGGTGDDVIKGIGGNDIIEGGEGDDKLWGGTGTDVIHGGQGDDIIYAYGSIAPDVNAEIFLENPSGLKPYDDDSVDTVSGGDGNDFIFGASGALLYGEAGDDALAAVGYVPGQSAGILLDGGEGFDIAQIVLDTNEPIHFSADPDAPLWLGLSFNSIEGFAFFSGSGNDELSGSGSSDILDGGAGNDILDGRGGIDQLQGGLGDDTYYVDSPGDIPLELADAGANDKVIVDFGGGAAVWGPGGGASAISFPRVGGSPYLSHRLLESLGIESLAAEIGAALDELASDPSRIVEMIGNSFDQAMTGSPYRDRLIGMGGDDELIGLAGNDILDGGEGDDTLDGGEGDDTYVVDSADDEVIEPDGFGDDDALIIDFSGGAASWTVEDNDGGAGGDGAAARPPGAGGIIVDRFLSTRLPDTLGIDLVVIAQLLDEAIGDLPSVLQAIGNAYKQTMIGNSSINRLLGMGGDDTLDGGGGDDLLEGGTGNDYYVVDSDGDVIIDTEGTFDHVTIDLSTVAGLIEEPEFTFDDDSGIELIELSTNWGFGKVIGENGASITLNGKANIFKSNLTQVEVDGGANLDTVLFSGPRNEYSFKSKGYDSDGTPIWLVTHERGAHLLEGTQTLRSFEQAAFGHAFVSPFALLDTDLLDLKTVQPNKTSNVAGSAFDDVLLQNASNGQVYFARMQDGAFQDWGAATGALGNDWTATASGNVNPSSSDGAETFVQQQSTGTIYYASLDTGAVSWGVVSTDLTADWKLRAAADVNRDASADVIVQNQTNGTIYFADMRDGTFRAWGVVNSNLTSDWVVVGAGDANRDGFADVIVQQQSTGTTYFANMAGGAFAGWGVISTTLTADWHVKAVGDVTGDGFADVIFQNSVGGPGVNPGTTYFADVSTGTVHWGVVTTTVSADWIVQGTADVDNDGFAEVLFQNLVGGAGINPGTTYYADMGAGGFQGWGAVATSITADWHVV